MKVISFIEDGLVIRAILEHLGIWLVRSRPPPKIHAPPTSFEPDAIELPSRPHQDTYCYADPDYSWDAYINS